MSAFMVSHKCLDRAVSLWSRGDTFGGDYIKACEDLDKLGNDLWRLNASAIKERYGEDTKPDEFTFSGRSYNRINALKALHWLIYQCTEGNVPKTALYQRMRRKEQEVANAIVSSLPEYEKSPWD